MVGEVEDGQRVMRWLRGQDFFDGRLLTWGKSYLGYTQWALAMDPPPELRAMVVNVGLHETAEVNYPGGVLSPTTSLAWAQGIVTQEERTLWGMLTGAYNDDGERVEKAVRSRPLIKNYEIATGRQVPFFEEWAMTAPTEPRWNEFDLSAALQRVDVPVLIRGGWFDVFHAQSLRQYRTLRDLGRDVHLTMGPWDHSSRGLSFGHSFDESVAWLHYGLGDGKPMRTSPVRFAVTGTRGPRWFEVDSWPPPYREVKYVLEVDGVLAKTGPAETAHIDTALALTQTEPDFTSYSYNPDDPTPAVGGAVLAGEAGSLNNSALEERSDVLTFTGLEMPLGLTIAGPITATIYASSSRPTADFMVRLCDVHPDGSSWNLCDTIKRVAPDAPEADHDGVWKLELELGEIAHRFGPRHRVRVQISSGAFPRFMPNTGFVEPPAIAVEATIAEQRIHHTALRPSQVTLPVALGRQ